MVLKLIQISGASCSDEAVAVAALASAEMKIPAGLRHK
jgi:hypothetical protein